MCCFACLMSKLVYLVPAESQAGLGLLPCGSCYGAGVGRAVSYVSESCSMWYLIFSNGEVGLFLEFHETAR